MGSRVVLLLALAGCSLAPRYTRPEAPVGSAWPASAWPASEGPGSAGLAAEGSVTAGTAADLGWRARFGDPRLQALLATALENNRDLRVAALNIERARALYRIQRADLLPEVGAVASAAFTNPDAPGAPVGTYYQVGLQLSYEIDFFGRIRSLKDAALAEYLATEEAARSAQIGLVAEVASAYLAERAYAEQLDIARRSLVAREASYELDRQRFDAGVSSELDLRQSETLVESARVSVASLARGRAQAENALTLLAGAALADLPAAVPLADQSVGGDLDVGVPSTVLLARPDILAAEQRLRGAHADIGAARAAFFPRISLTAALGTASGDLLGLFGGGAGVWSFVPMLTQPIFAYGQNRANLQVAKVDREIALAVYERTIQVAFREVADALVARETLDAQVIAQERLRAAEARRLELADQRYKAGASSHLERLDAERSLFDAERALILARQLRLANAVDLYAALGGGVGEE
ncbi:MAG: efflux transporter outer membrane subunit [Pseudomonadota bacterium]|nr:efflux transporter outer membrane subunit [Pseudomonadota bacterium]